MKTLSTLLCVFLMQSLLTHTNAQINITLSMADGVVATTSETVTFGVPFKIGQVTSIDHIKVSHNNIELAISARKGLEWWSDGSIRSVSIQVREQDMTNGDLTLTISLEARDTSMDFIFQDPLLFWETGLASKAMMPFPRVLALHDLDYLSESQIVPPYLIDSDVDQFDTYQNLQFDDWVKQFSYPNSSKGDWLFDRPSALFKAYLNTGRKDILKEAIQAKQFYFTYIRKDGPPPSEEGGIGCWTFGTTACADGKYIYTQPAKLALALVGDDSQWDNNLITNMALQADLGWNQYATRDPYDSETEGFTERGAGLVGLCELNAYELTGNTILLNHLNERIANLEDMQQTEQVWDISNNWIPKSGAFTHSVGVHENWYSPSNAPINNTNDRGFSTWMSENIVDFLWQTYWYTGNEKCPEMLRLFSHAINQFGFTSLYDYDSQTFIKKIEYFFVPFKGHPCIEDSLDTDLVYFGSAYANANTLVTEEWYAPFTNLHNVETILSLAAGYYFEEDPEMRRALKFRLDALDNSIFNSDCAQVSATKRLWNWQHRSNAKRTWDWIDNEITTTNVSINSSNDKKVSVYPNPSTNGFNIKSISKIEKVEIFDTNGHLLFKQNHPSNKIDFHTQNSNLYFIKTTTTDGIYLNKLIIQKSY